MAAETLAEAVDAALADAELRPRDGALVALVRRYATILDGVGDDEEVFANLGPKLADGLHKLGMSVTARAAAKAPEGGATGDPAAAALGKLQLIAGGAGRPPG